MQRRADAFPTFPMSLEIHTPLPRKATSRLAALYGRVSRRNRGILNFFATSLLSRGVSISCQLLQIPVALHYLGNEAFGLWMTFSGFSYLLTVADFGIGLGAQNEIAEAVAIGDQQRARRVFFTACGATTVVGALLALAVIPVCLVLDWGRLLKLTEPQTLRDVHAAAVLVAAVCCSGIATSIGQRLAYALQFGWLLNLQTTVVNLLGLAGVILASHFRLGLLGLFAVVLLPGFFLNLIMTVGLLRWTGWLGRKRFGGWSRAEVFDGGALRRLLSVGLLFFVQQVCDMSLYTVPALLISSMLGAAAVTPFNIGQRLFSLFLVIQNAFLPPLWPAYAEAKAMRDWAWVRRTLRRSVFASLALTITPMLAASLWAEPILRLWIGRKADAASLPGPTLLWLLFAWNAVMVMQQPYTFLLSGMSAVGRLSVYRIATAVCALGLMTLLGPTLGLPGIVTGLIAAMFVSLLGGVLETRRFLRDSARQDTAPPEPVSPLIPVPAR